MSNPCKHMDCSLLGSFVHGILQARILEWVAISFSRRSSQPRNRTQVSHIVGRRFTIWAIREEPFYSLFSSVQFSRSVVSDSLRPHESQHARPPCPSPTPGVHSDSRPSSQWCHPAIHPRSSPSPPAPNPSQHQSLFQWVIISLYYLFIDFKTCRDILKINNTAYLSLLSLFPLTSLTRGLLLLLFFQKTEFCLELLKLHVCFLFY